MTTPAFACSSCGSPIPPGEGHYSTPHGLFCLSCGLRLPIPPGARVTVTIVDPVDPTQSPAATPRAQEATYGK